MSGNMLASLLFYYIGTSAADKVVAMNFEMFSDVILTADLPEHRLRAGDVGTVVERHDVPGKEVRYSVEFFDMTGRTVAVVTVPGSTDT